MDLFEGGCRSEKAAVGAFQLLDLSLQASVGGGDCFLDARLGLSNVCDSGQVVVATLVVMMMVATTIVIVVMVMVTMMIEATME